MPNNINFDKVLTYAILAESSYHTYIQDSRGNLVDALGALSLPGWRAIDVSERVDGFYSVAFENTSTKEIVISYRGTSGGMDFLQYPALAGGLFETQALFARAFYAKVSHDYPTRNITSVGHSLGGALSNFIGLTIMPWQFQTQKNKSSYPF